MLRLLPTLSAPGSRQMALDEALLQESGEPTIRLYRWQPAAVSLGYFQDHGSIAPRLPAGLEVVRRITGGGAIWHEHEVTYCLVGRLGQGPFPTRSQELYAPLHAAVLAELAARGARLGRQERTVGDRRYRDEPRCFASPAEDDLVDPHGGKVLGSAARARGDRFLLHGSLKLASNPWDGDQVAPCGLDEAGAAEALLAGVARAFAPLATGTWTPGELAAAERIGAARYATLDWVVHRRGPRP